MDPERLAAKKEAEAKVAKAVTLLQDAQALFDAHGFEWAALQPGGNSVVVTGPINAIVIER